LGKDPGIKSFRDVSAEALERYSAGMDEVVYRRCRYVVNEIQRTRLASELLTMDRIEDFGQLMYQTHDGLSKEYEVSCKELDFLVHEAKKNDVTGARLMGGGFGGCTINLVANERYDEAVANITTAYKNEFGRTADVIAVKIGDGTHEIGG
jgi:galactokinase